MDFRDQRFWALVNAILLLGIIALLAYLLIGRGRHAASAPESDASRRDQPVPPATAPAGKREVDAGRVWVRPVSFTANTVPPDNMRDAWSLRGVQPQEWARLPASPGMDMAETSAGYLLTFSLPGVRNEDIRLTMTDRVVTVQAVIRDSRGNRVGGMERRVLLPRIPGDPAEFEALFTNGILHVSVAK